MPIPSFVRAPHEISASFSEPAKRTASATSSADRGRTTVAGAIPSTAYSAQSDGSEEATMPPSAVSRREIARSLDIVIRQAPHARFEYESEFHRSLFPAERFFPDSKERPG